MVGLGDETSNPQKQLLAEWNKNTKTPPECLEQEFGADIEQLFDTLAEWNDYLEKYVPYFQKPQEPKL